MSFILMERVLKNFKSEARVILKRLNYEDEYPRIEPYFEEAIDQLPEERKELFYLRFNDHLNEIRIAKTLNISLLDIAKELSDSILFVLNKSKELSLENNA